MLRNMGLLLHHSTNIFNDHFLFLSLSRLRDELWNGMSLWVCHFFMGSNNNQHFSRETNVINTQQSLFQSTCFIQWTIISFSNFLSQNCNFNMHVTCIHKTKTFNSSDSIFRFWYMYGNKSYIFIVKYNLIISFKSWSIVLVNSENKNFFN